MSNSHRECEKHPEGGLNHLYLFCYCDLKEAEAKGRLEESKTTDAVVKEKWDYGEVRHKQGLLRGAEIAEKYEEDKFYCECDHGCMCAIGMAYPYGIAEKIRKEANK